MVLKQNENETMASDEGSDSAAFLDKKKILGRQVWKFFVFSFLETKPTATDSSEPTPLRYFFNFSYLAFLWKKTISKF